MSNQHTEAEPAEKQQQTKKRIITAASKVLAEKGYDVTTLREISREAQAAPGLVHYYFGGKDGLLVEALQAAGQQFHRRYLSYFGDMSQLYQAAASPGSQYIAELMAHYDTEVVS